MVFNFHKGNRVISDCLYGDDDSDFIFTMVLQQAGVVDVLTQRGN